MSASDPEEQFYTQFDKLYCKVFSHDLTANSPQGRFKDKLYFYVKERCAEVDDWRINETNFGQLVSDFIGELAG